jgi:ubiquinone/menaquinone biosynthesis C-methylase UbiE
VDRAERFALQRILTDVPPGVAADIGAGTGHFAAILADRCEVVAVEPSLEMLHAGVRRTAGLPVRWCIGACEHLPLGDARVDGALLMTVLEWAGDPQRCIDEARRVLRPGGWLVVGYLPALSPWAALYRRLADEGVAPWSTARFFVRGDLEALVGAPPDTDERAVYPAPQAEEPWEAADTAGRRAGNLPALEVLRWNLR